MKIIAVMHSNQVVEKIKPENKLWVEWDGTLLLPISNQIVISRDKFH